MWPFGYAQDMLRLVPRLFSSKAELNLGFVFFEFYQHLADSGMWPFGYAQDRLRLVPRLLGSKTELNLGFVFLNFISI